MPFLLIILGLICFPVSPLEAESYPHKSNARNRHKHKGNARPKTPLFKNEKPTIKKVPQNNIFKPHENSFDIENASTMAYLSYLAYHKMKKGKPDIEAVRKALAEAGWGSYTIEPIDYSPVQGFILKGKDHDVVIFRGSDEIQDWIDNANAFYPMMSQEEFLGKLGLNKKKEDDAPAETVTADSLHKGFNKQYENAHKGIFRQLKGEEGKRVVFGGHSLGGALASIFARDFHNKHGFKNIGLYTFGAPRPGNDEHASYFVKNKIPAFRVEFNLDPVPSLPDLVRFKPVGEPWLLSKLPFSHPKIGKPAGVNHFLKNLTASLGLLLTSRDHSSVNYVNHLMEVPRPRRRVFSK